MHEAAQHADNCMLTLTYDDQHLPSDNSLDVSDFQRFFKRLRKRFSPRKIKYYHCGEYGEQFGRPHYHAIVFGLDFQDKEVLGKTSAGSTIYNSPLLTDIWGHGYTSIGDVTFESAAYVARYIMKKVTGKDAEEHYQGRKPEYTTMSNGIGKGHFEKYHKSIMENDSVVLNNKVLKPPRYYDKLAERIDKELYEINKFDRESRSIHNKVLQREYNRRDVKEKVAEHRLNKLKRKL